MTALVVDASVAIKWLISQTGSPEARALARPGVELIAPDLLLIEVANVLWRSVRLKRIRAADAELANDVLPRSFTRIEPSRPLARRALALAMALDHPVYDCVYFALAEREAAPLITADKRLLAAGAKLAGVSVQPLAPSVYPPA